LSDLESNAKKKILSLIDGKQEDIINFLGEYIRHKSTNPDLAGKSLNEEKDCQNWIKEKLKEFKFFDKIDLWEISEGRPNIAAVWKGSGNGKNLLLNGHSDTVPVTDEHKKNWSGPDPWNGEVKDGKVWGRGAADMKGGITAFIMATKLLHDAGIKLKGDVILTTVIGEESGRHEIGCDTVLDRGYRAPFAIITELTGLRIYPVLKGEIYFRIKVKGKATHICNRNKCGTQPLLYNKTPMGISAIDKMMKIYNIVMELERQWVVYRQHPAIPPGGQFININTIKGGESFTSVPDSCEVTGSLLFNPGLTSNEVIKEVKEAINSVVCTDYWLKDNPPEIEIPWNGLVKEPVEVSVDNEGCQTLACSYKEVIGEKPEITFSPFVADGNFWFPKGQQLVTFGPGEIEQAHGIDEFVSIDQLIKSTKVLSVMIINWCKVNSIKN
jgi:acetylornithine deacetylase